MGKLNTHKIIAAGVFAIELEQGRILLCKRGEKCVHPKKWAPFGGTYEIVDKIPTVTAQREFKEESGCQVPYLISKLPIYINEDNFLTFYTFLGLFNKPFDVTLNEENLNSHWFHLDEIPKNLLPGFGELLSNKYDDIKLFIEKNKLRNV